MWLDDRDRGVLEQARLAAFDDVMATRAAAACGCSTTARTGISARPTSPGPSCGMYLKKHRVRTWWTWLRAKLGLRPAAGAGRVEADNVRALAALGIPVMRVVACGEKLYGDGRFESFLLTEELAGYAELEGFLRRRFPACRARGVRGRASCFRGCCGRWPRIARRLPCGRLQSSRLELLPFPGQGARGRASSTCG